MIITCVLKMVVIHPLDAGIHFFPVTITTNVPKILAILLPDVSILLLSALTKILVNVLTVTPLRDVFTTILSVTITTIVQQMLVTPKQKKAKILVSTPLLSAMIILYVLTIFAILTTVVVNTIQSLA